MVVFDKTGTLTYGKFEVEAVHPDDFDEHELLHLAAHVEHFSTHPIGAALRNAFPAEAVDGCEVTNVEEIAGREGLLGACPSQRDGASCRYRPCVCGAVQEL